MPGILSSPLLSPPSGPPGVDQKPLVGAPYPWQTKTRRACRWRACGAIALAAAGSASAYTANINAAAPKTIYLQVGVGSFTNIYMNGGQPGNNATINTVSVTVAPNAVGDGVAKAMTTNSPATDSFLDGFTFCTVPGQLYIGGFYRTANGNTVAAQVTATVPLSLTDATGDTIPFSKIRWTSSGIADVGAEPFPAATFVAGGTQNVGSMASNTWNESCWTFSYLNNTTPPAGTYSGTVVYTMVSP